MAQRNRSLIVGIDVGATKTNATVIDTGGACRVDAMFEIPSLVSAGPQAALRAISEVFQLVIEANDCKIGDVVAVGLGTPGPASSVGVLSGRGATNFGGLDWCSFDLRTATEVKLKLPVVYSNDGNAAALYAHRMHFADKADVKSSVSAIVGTGLGGGVVVDGRVVVGAAGMGGELGHVHIPMDGLLAEGQPVPQCNCGFFGDLESIASLTGIRLNLLPYWLGRYPQHPLASIDSIDEASMLVRGYGERGDEMALKLFGQQADAIGRMFTIASNFVDPEALFVGGGIVESAPHFREWFLDRVSSATYLRDEQRGIAQFAVVPDLDMAGARGAALAALQTVNGG